MTGKLNPRSAQAYGSLNARHAGTEIVGRRRLLFSVSWMYVETLKPDVSSAELEDTVFKARAAVGALELMERQLTMIAKSAALRPCKAQIAEIKRSLRSLMASLGRIADRAEKELKQRQLAGEAVTA